MLPNINDIDPETRALIESKLPATALDFVRLIGLESTLALINEFGGTDITFPKYEGGKAAALFDDLAAVIGRENLTRIDAEYGGGQRVYIPRCYHSMNVLRNRQIINEFDELTRETSVRLACNAIARRYRTSAKQVENIVNGKCKNRAKPAE